jgi:hypothetical protein
MPLRQVPRIFKVAFSLAGEQRDLVRSIAEGVEQALGASSVFLDEWFEYYIGGDGGDLKLQEIYRKGCEMVVVCISQSYAGKPWTQAEYDAIRARVMKARGSAVESDRLRIFPIRVGEGDVPGIYENTIAPEARGRVQEIVEMIVSRLNLIVGSDDQATAPQVAEWPARQVTFSHGLADRSVNEWPAVLDLLVANARKRILMFRGPSGYSKSAVLTAACRCAKSLGIPTAYIDFTDSTLLSEANVLKELQSELGGILPAFAAQRDPDRWSFRQALRAYEGAALILLDTYEKAAGIKQLVEWIETHLLAEAEECENLRFLIGGQEVPDSDTARWRACAQLVKLGRIHDQNIWKTWIRQINPNIDDKHVEGIVVGLEGVPANISTALQTFAHSRAKAG